MSFKYNNRKLRTALFRLVKLKYINRWIVFTSDLIISLLVSLIVAFGFLGLLHIELSFHDLLKVAFFSFLGTILASLLFKSYSGIIRHSTLRGLWRIGGVALLKVAIIYLLMMLLGLSLTEPLRWATLAIDCTLTIVALVGFRVAMINVYNFLLCQLGKQRKQVLVYGTDAESVAIASSATRHIFMHNYSIMGFLTMNQIKKSFRLAELPVYSIDTQEELLSLVPFLGIEGILFPNIRSVQQEQNRLIRFCEQINLLTLVVPEMEELQSGVARQRTIRNIRIEDLLGRDEIKINLQEIAALMNGKCILVTGAAGSIGSEICRQLAHFNIRQLICFDSAETPMHNLRLELEDKYPGLHFVPVIGDVRSPDRVDYVFRNWKPQIVFHAAAYKHVPLMEENPCEAIRVNVQGTRLVADTAVKYQVEKFVMISTDKAVNPTNIMGCSKRIAEIYVQSLSLAIARKEIAGETRFITTRFGNVLGSSGSVIPRFRKQIESGGPVTVTHPDIIRYFMTIPEACRLVLEAGTLGGGGEIFVFDMGKPVKIMDLARRMIELSGLEPDVDIPITITGLRPGEKLYKELLSDEESTRPTLHNKIRVASVREYAYSEALAQVENLTEQARIVDIQQMVKDMKQFVPEFKSNHSEFEKLDV
ncbi:MAG: nucleoside-diphosphate sugar epimerase/dehydratase [Bacteroidales bacterium]